MFLISLIKSPPGKFNLSDYIQFVQSATRSSPFHKIHSTSRAPHVNSIKSFYFNRIVCIWNSLPPVELESSFNSLRKVICNFHWDNFISSYDIDNPCSWSIVGFEQGVPLNNLLLTLFLFLTASEVDPGHLFNTLNFPFKFKFAFFYYM